jgi:hypothetical protein
MQSQPFGQPSVLYQDNVLSARGCLAKANACDCHYASCTETGDCACGWDDVSKSCRAGIPTKCSSCPSMHRCSTSQKLKIGPDGFPVPGQLSVWEPVPYPDETPSSTSGDTSSTSGDTISSSSVPISTGQTVSGGKAAVSGGKAAVSGGKAAVSGQGKAAVSGQGKAISAKPYQRKGQNNQTRVG